MYEKWETFGTRKRARQHYYKTKARQLSRICPLTTDTCTENCASFEQGKFWGKEGTFWNVISCKCTNALVSGVLTMEET